MTPGRRFPDMASAIADLEAATDWEEAEANGRVIPHQVLLSMAVDSIQCLFPFPELGAMFHEYQHGVHSVGLGRSSSSCMIQAIEVV